jgi:protease I
MRALIISADNFEDSELLVPYYRLREEGIAVDIASFKHGRIHGKHGYEIDVNVDINKVHAQDYDALVLPGGKAPAILRKNARVLEVARAFMSAGKPVAAICHGPQILVSAGLLNGRAATCYRSVADELKAGGARYEDADVVVDGNLVTSRQPSDLPAFLRELMKQVRAAGRAAAA